MPTTTAAKPASGLVESPSGSTEKTRTARHRADWQFTSEARRSGLLTFDTCHLQSGGSTPRVLNAETSPHKSGRPLERSRPCSRSASFRRNPCDDSGSQDGLRGATWSARLSRWCGASASPPYCPCRSKGAVQEVPLTKASNKLDPGRLASAWCSVSLRTCHRPA